MIGDSLLLSAASVLGFVGGLFGLLLVLAWLEHPEPPSWLRRRRSRSRRRVVVSTPARRRPSLVTAPGRPRLPAPGIADADD